MSYEFETCTLHLHLKTRASLRQSYQLTTSCFHIRHHRHNQGAPTTYLRLPERLYQAHLQRAPVPTTRRSQLGSRSLPSASASSSYTSSTWRQTAQRKAGRKEEREREREAEWERQRGRYRGGEGVVQTQLRKRSSIDHQSSLHCFYLQLDGERGKSQQKTKGMEDMNKQDRWWRHLSTASPSCMQTSPPPKKKKRKKRKKIRIGKG